MRDPASVAAAEPPPLPPPSSPPRLLPHWLALALRGWWALAAFAGAAILGDLLLLPLALTPDHWLRGVEDQFGALFGFVQANPLGSALIAAALVLLTIEGAIANQRERQAEALARALGEAELVSEGVAGKLTPPLDNLASGQRDIQQGQGELKAGQETLQAGQTVDIALGAATLAEIAQLRLELAAALALIAQKSGATAAASVTHRIFLSSTSLDLGHHRATLGDALARMDQFAIDMKQFGAGGADATTVSLTELATAEFVVLLVAWRYGFVPDQQTRSITRQEYEEATRRGLPVFVYLADPATEADASPGALFPADTRQPEYAAQIAAFRAELMDSSYQTFEFFTTPDDLAKKVATRLARRLLRDAKQRADVAANPLPRPDASGRVIALADKPARVTLSGRETQLATLTNRLISGEAVGVYALQGMGGVGKTALASEAVELLWENTGVFPGGVIWLACAGKRGDAGLLEILTQLARVIGRDDLAAISDLATLRQKLSGALRERTNTLLALDNIEPDLDTALALQTLSAPGHTTLLLTARDQLPAGLVKPIPLASLPTAAAAAMFAQRLAQNTDGARPTAEDEVEIPALVEAVGGLPLAIDQQAARASEQGLALGALRQELAAAGVNAAAFTADPARTLTAIFAHSLAPHPPHVQRLFAALGMLAESGFPREAALALAAAAIPGPERPAADASAPDTERIAAAALSALVRAALVEPLASDRLRLHPMLRAYARDRLAALDPSVRDTLGDAMLAYWVAFAQAHNSDRNTIPHEMDTQEAEAPGLMDALTWAHDHARPRAVLDLAYALNLTWHIHARRAEERMFRPWAVAAARALDDRRDLEFMTHELAVLDARTGEPQRARAGYAEALALARELGDKHAMGVELSNLGALELDAGDVMSARARLDKGLGIAHEISDAKRIAECEWWLGELERRHGSDTEACQHFKRALAIFERIEDPDAEITRRRLRDLGCEP